MSQPSNGQSSAGPPSGKVTRPSGKPNRQPTYSPPPTYTARPRTHAHKAKPGVEPAPIQRFDPQVALLRGHYLTRARRSRMRLIVLIVIAIMAVSGTLIYAFVSDVFWRVSDAWTTIFIPPPPTRPDAKGTPVAVIIPDWGKEPVNILLLGLDLREDDKDTRADTQILVHIDPVSKSAAMVSIPRDLFVPIPGFQDDRINAAYQLGESNAATIPGGGPSLSMATVEHNLGVPVHYFVQVDFEGFEQVIDAIGGLTIDAPRPLIDNEYPLGSFGVTRLYVPAGLQHMDGHTALTYARSRHVDSDLGRNSRQQQVLLAARQQGLSINLIPKIPELADKLKHAIKTDLLPEQVGSLYKLAQSIGGDSIHSFSIDANMVNEVRLPDNRLVLMPDWEVIRPMVLQTFADPRLAKEAARISVQNGTANAGTGKEVQDQLIGAGFFVPDLRARPWEERGSYPLTTITDYSGGDKPRTLQALCDTLELDCSHAQRGDPAEAPIALTDGLPVDVMIIAGDDKLQ